MNSLNDLLSETNEGKIAELICNEPLLYKGLTTTELISFGIIFFVSWSVSGFVVMLIFTGSILSAVMALPAGLILTIVTLVILAEIVLRLKRNRPDGYYEQWLLIKLQEYRLGYSHLIVTDMQWGI